MEDKMLFIRCLEDRLQELCNEGQAGDLHFSRGQEAISVGVCAALKDTDYLVTHHRTIAHAVAKGVPLESLVAEVLGKATGLNGGLAGEMHLSHLPSRFMFSFQLVGTCVPVAAGLAWVVKNVLKTNDIVVCFHGDAATANGQWHEGVNLAAVQKLPVLFVCENNHLAGNVTPEYYQPQANTIWRRFKSYGIVGKRIDGNNVEQVCCEAKIGAGYIRAYGKPYFLECDTTRLGRHKQGMGDIRTPEEMAGLALRDPLRDVAPERYAEVREEVDELIIKVQQGP